MSTVRSFPGAATRAPEFITMFVRALNGVATTIRTRHFWLFQEPSHRLPLDERLLRDIGISRAEIEKLREESQARATPESEALSHHGLCPGEFLNGMRRDCRRSDL